MKSEQELFNEWWLNESEKIPSDRRTKMDYAWYGWNAGRNEFLKLSERIKQSNDKT